MCNTVSQTHVVDTCGIYHSVVDYVYHSMVDYVKHSVVDNVALF